MSVVRNDKVGLGRNGAIHKLVVIRINGEFGRGLCPMSLFAPEKG